MPDNVTIAKGRLGATARWHPEKVAEVRRELKFARAEVYVKRLMSEPPWLNDDERNSLISVIRGDAP